jgi:hypothetical protein
MKINNYNQMGLPKIPERYWYMVLQKYSMELFQVLLFLFLSFLIILYYFRLFCHYYFVLVHIHTLLNDSYKIFYKKYLDHIQCKIF